MWRGLRDTGKGQGDFGKVCEGTLSGGQGPSGERGRCQGVGTLSGGRGCCQRVGTLSGG